MIVYNLGLSRIEVRLDFKSKKPKPTPPLQPKCLMTVCKTREKNQTANWKPMILLHEYRCGSHRFHFLLLLVLVFLCHVTRPAHNLPFIVGCCFFLNVFFVAKILKIYLLEHMNLEEQGVIHMNLGSWK